MAATRSGPRRPYSPEEVSQTLLAIAMHRGVVTDAHRHLEKLKKDGELDRAPSVKTMEAWKRDNAEEYHRIAAEIVPQIRQVIAQQNAELIERYARIEHNVLNKIEEQLDRAGTEDPDTGERIPDIPVKDLVAMQRNMTVGRGISTDKYRDVTGEQFKPTGEKQDVTEIMQGLQKQFPNAFVIIPPAAETDQPPAQVPALPALPAGNAEPVEKVKD